MKFDKLPIEDLLLIEPVAFEDDRGFFMETYKASEFWANGITSGFVQDNHSRSVKGVLRGLHFQRPPHAQGKLVRVAWGTIWDVAVDLRKGSATYGKWFGVELSSTNRLMMYIPEGFAHGYVTLSEEAHFIYKCTGEYEKSREGGVRWNDPDLNINWPIRDVIVSAKDSALPHFRDLQ